jgi:squalene-hopene/tetraprenyl-beta-curcumene cyclase
MKINLVGCEFRTPFVFRGVGVLNQLSVISQKKKEIGNQSKFLDWIPWEQKPIFYLLIKNFVNKIILFVLVVSRGCRTEKNADSGQNHRNSR